LGEAANPIGVRDWESGVASIDDLLDMGRSSAAPLLFMMRRD